MGYKNFKDFWEVKKPQIKEISKSIKGLDFALFLIHITNILLILTLFRILGWCVGYLIIFLIPILKTFYIYNTIQMIAETGLGGGLIFCFHSLLKQKGIDFGKIISFKEVFEFEKNPSLKIFIGLYIIILFILLFKYLFKFLPNFYGRTIKQSTPN